MNYTFFTIFKRALRQARFFLPHIAGIFILNVLLASIHLLRPFAWKVVVDNAFGSHPLPKAITLFFPDNFYFSFLSIITIAATIVIIIAIIENVITACNWALGTFTGEKLVLDFRSIVFNHVQHLSIAYHDAKGTSDSLYIVQWDAAAIRNLLLGNLITILSSLISLLIMLFILFSIDWKFAAIALCIMPPLFFITRFSNKRVRKHWDKVKENESRAMSVLHEVLGALRVVKAFGQEKGEEQRFKHRAEEAIKGQMKVAWRNAGFSFITGMLFATAAASFIYLGSKNVYSGHMTLGELILAVVYLNQVLQPLQTVSKSLSDVQASVSSLQRVFGLLDTEKEVAENNNALPLARVKGDFEFSDVSFSYNKEILTLKDVSFKINAGDRVGVMGTTGAGKSTLISLLIRFYDPTAGRILVDGTNIKNYKLKDYRSQFGLVLQEPVLFSTTIGENISYGLPGASEEDIIRAAKAANAHEFITKCKDGYNTMVGERGMQLSGGERQRISIARAFIKNAPVLILDEPTSSVDVNTEGQIMDAMERLMEGRTSFLITHRLDTLNACNIILHLEKGKVIDIINNKDTHTMVNKIAAFTSGINY